MSRFNSTHRVLMAGVLTVVSLGAAGTAVAQIVPDATLLNNTVVTPSGNTVTISEGTTVGGNLFHSFSEFGVPTGSEAFFNNATTIENIITRVTGGKISNIDGLMRANGSANLFLINPNGIVFGPNARLDIGGSFFGSTAESIMFENGQQFSTANPQAPPLLTINVPLGLQYGPNARPIVNQSVVGLEVKQGNTLALIGGNVTLEGSDMRAPSGRIELGSVGDNQQVSITSTDNFFFLGYNEVNNFSDVELSGGATVDVSGEPSGSVRVQARNFRLSEDAKITSINSGSQPGGGIQISATEKVELIGTGNYVEGLVVLVDNGIANNDNLPSGLFTTDESTGSGGDIAIDTNQLIARDGIFIYAITEGEGRGGDFTINASESVILSAASLRANVSVEATGNGGNLTVNTGRLLMEEVAELGTLVEGAGQGGNLTINASESIDLVGTNLIIAERSDGTPLITGTLLVAGAELGSSGDSGELRLSTRRLSVRDGSAVIVNSLGKGRPGNLFLTATSEAEFIGTSPDQFAASSSIRAGALDPSAIEIGGGNVRVTAGNLILRDEGAILVNNVSVGSGGSVEIVANSILLDNEARIEAETAFGQGGNIVLRTQDLRLRGNSTITATAGSFEQSSDNFPPEVAAFFTALETGVGDGGNIIIETDTLVALDNSDITANAQEGFGGRVLITTQGIFGTEFRSELTPESDITASSALGASFSGVVEIKIQDADRASGIIKLPESPLDASHLLGKDFCSVVAEADSSFVITGRGGIPRNPGDTLPGMTTRVNLVDPVFGEETRSRREPVARENTRSPEIVEAQGWYVNSEGEVVLTANPTIINPQTSGLVHPQCHLPGER